MGNSWFLLPLRDAFRPPVLAMNVIPLWRWSITFRCWRRTSISVRPSVECGVVSGASISNHLAGPGWRAGEDTTLPGTLSARSHRAIVSLDLFTISFDRIETSIRTRFALITRSRRRSGPGYGRRASCSENASPGFSPPSYRSIFTTFSKRLSHFASAW